MRRRSLLPLAVLALALHVPWSAARATTVLPLDAGDLAARAALIVTGTAVHWEVVPSRDGAFPFTFVTFRVDDTLKGAVRGGELTLRFHGGILGGREVWIHGTPEFAVGERYLLFVRGNGIAGFPVVGWRQGQLRFDRDPGSGRPILFDADGTPVRGIEDGRWLRGPAAEGSTRRGVLLATEGLTVSDEPPAAARAGEMPAGEVLAALRSLLAAGAGRPGFAPGRLVESARADQVPDRVDFAAPRVP